MVYQRMKCTNEVSGVVKREKRVTRRKKTARVKKEEEEGDKRGVLL